MSLVVAPEGGFTFVPVLAVTGVDIVGDPVVVTLDRAMVRDALVQLLLGGSTRATWITGVDAAGVVTTIEVAAGEPTAVATAVLKWWVLVLDLGAEISGVRA